ncbi:MAG: murein biosynthesis integral membrane protein MurJ [Rhizobiales bacterium]|nr:murein biosynthesis integral membrane protein MurJ [Hyphomicrobiales bacterium]
MGLMAKFFSVGSATLGSRFLGFAREALIASTLGAGPVADAFYAAFRFPNLFRRLFAEGAFNTAFVPLFAKELEGNGRAGAKDFAEQILSVLIFALLIITALAMIFMPFLVSTIIAPKFAANPDKFDLTILLTRIMFPYLAAMSLVAMFSGILNSFRKYFLAALAPVILNIILVGVLVFALWQGLEDRYIGIVLAWGVVVSGVVQIGLLTYGIIKEGFSIRPRVPKITPPVKRLLILAVPTAIAGGITQINLLVGQVIASAQDGAISIMNYADRLMQLPLGVIGIAIGVVLLPELTRALAAKDEEQSIALQNRSLEFGLGLTVPAAVGLFIIPLPLIALIYERGAFTRELSETTSMVLAAFAIGLPSFVLIKIFQPSFYAREDMRTPMWFSGANALINIILSLILFPIYGVVGLAIATSSAGWVNAFLLGITLYWQKHFVIKGQTLKNVLLILLASAVMGAILYVSQIWIGDYLLDRGLLIRLGAITLTVGFAAIIYFAIVIATGAIPREQIKRMLRR